MCQIYLVQILPVTLNPTFPSRGAERAQFFNGKNKLILQTFIYFEIKPIILHGEKYFNWL